jgi:glutathione S-transferase
MHLVIGYKNYSSWSLRPWILMKVAKIEFTETVMPFMHGEMLRDYASKHRIPAQVPVLEHDGLILPDSLAIAEYLAERYPEACLWPQEQQLRALARAASAEMHSGFQALRSACPMNCRATKTLASTDEIRADLQRLAVIWDQFEQRIPANVAKEGDFLCGRFGIVDAMYAPVMWRVRGYGFHVSDAFARWSDAMFALPEMQQWLDAAINEEWTIAHYDAVGKSQ